MVVAHAILISEEEVAVLVDKISTACDGHSMAAIMVAITDVFAAMADSHTTLTVSEIMHDLVSLSVQRHAASDHSIN